MTIKQLWGIIYKLKKENKELKEVIEKLAFKYKLTKKLGDCYEEGECDE